MNPSTIQVYVKYLDDTFQTLKHCSPEAIGYDLCAYHNTSISPKTIAKIRTGICLEITDASVYGRICSKSSLVLKSINVLGGIIDSDFRNEVIVLLYNFGEETFHIKKGLEIAQIIFEKTCIPLFERKKQLSITTRGERGFGECTNFLKI